MGQRLDLQNILIDTLGNNNVYFQAPSDASIKYPCIVYSRTTVDVKRANNIVYNATSAYKVMLITRDPDNDTYDKLVRLPLSAFETSYVAQNLYHYVFKIFY